MVVRRERSGWSPEVGGNVYRVECEEEVVEDDTQVRVAGWGCVATNEYKTGQWVKIWGGGQDDLRISKCL